MNKVKISFILTFIVFVGLFCKGNNENKKEKKQYIVALYRDKIAAKAIQAMGYFKKNYNIDAYVYDTKHIKGLERGYYYVITNFYDEKIDAEIEETKLKQMGLKPKIFEIIYVH